MSVEGGDDVLVPGDGQSEFAVEFNPHRDTYRVQFVMESQLPSEAVIAGVAYASGYDPLDLPPLFRTLDPDSLDSIFATTTDEAHRLDISVTFEYAGYVVTVDGRGSVDLKLSH